MPNTIKGIIVQPKSFDGDKDGEVDPPPRLANVGVEGIEVALFVRTLDGSGSVRQSKLGTDQTSDANGMVEFADISNPGNRHDLFAAQVDDEGKPELKTAVFFNFDVAAENERIGGDKVNFVLRVGGKGCLLYTSPSPRD